ncbi:hypothetical protein [Burkholderia stagnalis]|nr:hypothetical protein [Burkholderia stagnalis]KVM86938.1 hypothetical protein WT05_12990 [Burkholderia stagnalis]KVN55755.1 hypothetical protein WT14_28355 [Burkholderia stagnalis]
MQFHSTDHGAERRTEYASLAGSHAVNAPSGAVLMQVLPHGTGATVGGRTQQILGVGGAYSDSYVTALADFVLSHFGSKQGTVTAEQVRAQCVSE